jgi:hypothetical protein
MIRRTVFDDRFSLLVPEDARMEAGNPLSDVLSALARLAEEGKPFRALLEFGGASAELVVRPAKPAAELVVRQAGAVTFPAPAAQAGRAGPPRELTGTQQAVVDVLATAEAPIKVRTIARLAGRVYNSNLRDAVAQLKRQGVIYRPDESEARYWPVGQPLPGGAP